MSDEPIIRTLRIYALPDPHDERDAWYTPIFTAAADEIDRLVRECSRKDAQIREAIALLEQGTEYDKLHVTAVLHNALRGE